MKDNVQKTILLVEVEAIIAMSEKMTLEKFGYQVLTALNGEEAIATVAKTPAIDLILMDIDLGAGIDGTEAAEIILRDRDIPIMFLTSHPEPEIIARTEKITSYGFIVKNSSTTVFQALIKMVFKLFESKKNEGEKAPQKETAVEALRESEERFHSFFDNSIAGIYRTAPDGCIHLANPALVRMLGYSSFAELADKDLNKSGFEPSYPRAQFVAKIENNGEVQGLESVWKRKDGGSIIVRESARAIRDTHGKTLYYDGIVEDITEIKRSEKLTAALYGISQAMFTSGDLDDLYPRIHGLIAGIVPATNFFIALLTDDGQVLKFPYYRDEKDTSSGEVIKTDDPQSLTVEVLRTKKPLLLNEAQLRERYATGRNRVWGTAPKCWLGVPLRIGNEVIGVMVIQDYNDGSAYSQGDVMLLESTAGQVAVAIARKRAEVEIKRQLAEKEILLREVHHRIKNNIATIAGLLTLRVKSLSNPEAIAVLQDAIGRVDSMRILYDKLLLGEGFKEVSVKKYIDSLIDMVVALFPGGARIVLDKRIADFQLDAKRLFPLGIIINELLTNIMKYAFTGRDAGSIKFSLANANGRITLTIADDGIGLPAGFDAERSDGFGLMLVKMLSRQLGGSFTIERHRGTRCTVSFDV